MEHIFKYWRLSYYIEPALFLMLVVTLYISVSKLRFLPQAKFLPIYLSLFLLLMINEYVFKILYPKTLPNQYQFFEGLANYLVTVAEFYAFNYFIYSVTRTNQLKKYILFTSAICSAFFLYAAVQVWESHAGNVHTPLNNLYILESTVLLPICTFYFIEQFRIPSETKLLHSPDFWISSGLLIYFACTFPLTLIAEYLHKTNKLLIWQLYHLIYIFYIVLYGMIIIAYNTVKKEASTKSSGYKTSNNF